MLCLTRGRAFEALENRNRSRVWFAEALRMDARCYEALEHIVDTYMFTAAEGKSAHSKYFKRSLYYGDMIIILTFQFVVSL